MSVVAMVAAALAAWLAFPDPGRLTRRRPSAGPAARSVGWSRAWLVGGPTGVVVLLIADGWPWPVRVGLAVLAAGGVAFGLTRLTPDRMRKDQARRRRGMPATLRLLAAAVGGAGLPLRRAVAEVAEALEGPLRRDLEQVSAGLRVGMPEEDAWLLLDADPVWHGIAADIGRAAASGTGLAALLRQHAQDAEEDRWAALQERARTVGVRSVLPLMVCFLPAFVLIGIVPVVGSLIAELVGP